MPVTVADARHVYVVNGGGVRTNFRVPGDGAAMQPAVAWQGYFYVADDATGVVHVFNSAGRRAAADRVRPAGRPARAGGSGELPVHQRAGLRRRPGWWTTRTAYGRWTSTPTTSSAAIRRRRRRRRRPRRKPKVPPVSKPGPPRNVRAAAGNAEAPVTWQAAAANGAAIIRVRGGRCGQDVLRSAPNQRSVDVTGLTNGADVPASRCTPSTRRVTGRRETQQPGAPDVRGAGRARRADRDGGGRTARSR